MTAQSTLWLSPDAIKGRASWSSRPVDDDAVVREQYEIWHHAGQLPANQNSAHSLTSCLIQLNRIVDLRDMTLDTHFNFRKIPGLNGKKRHEIMELLDIVKPLMRRKLDSLRNRLMHFQGSQIPSLNKCAERAEFVWYFLKSTDRMAMSPIDCVNFCYDISEAVWMSEGSMKSGVLP